MAVFIEVKKRVGLEYPPLGKRFKRAFNAESEPVKVQRVESPLVLETSHEVVAKLTTGLNTEIAKIVNTIKRWYDGGYGDATGENSEHKKLMQDFFYAALHNINNKHLVRSLTLLIYGGETCYASALGCIKGSAKEEPINGPLEKAINKKKKAEKNLRILREELVSLGESADPKDTAKKATKERAIQKKIRANQSKLDDAESNIPKMDSYVALCNLCKDQGFTPLAMLKDLIAKLNQANDPEASFGKNWHEVILDEAIQHLKSHIKLVKRYNKDEAARRAEVEDFKESEDGKAYLEACKKYCQGGIPRSRSERLKLFSIPALAKWRKEKTEFVSGRNLTEIMERNKELQVLRDLNTKYQNLTRVIRPPKWTPVSEKRIRYPFIEDKLFSSKGIEERTTGSGQKYYSVSITVPDFEAPHQTKEVEIQIAQTKRLKGMKKVVEEGVSPWTMEGIDEITGKTYRVEVSGFRFDKHGDRWIARPTFKKIDAGHCTHVANVLAAVRSGAVPDLTIGDMFAVFVLDPKAERTDKRKNSAGWLQVYGVEDNDRNGSEGKFARLLFNQPIRAESSVQVGNSAHRKGYSVSRGEGTEPTVVREQRAGIRSTAYGASTNVTFPQMMSIKDKIDRLWRISKILRKPEGEVRDIFEDLNEEIGNTLLKLITVRERNKAIAQENSTRTSQNQTILKENQEKLAWNRAHPDEKKELQKGHSLSPLESTEQLDSRISHLTYTVNMLSRALQNQSKYLDDVRDKIKSLRTHLFGMKDNYRHTVAKEVVRRMQRIREGKSGEKQVDDFRKANPGKDLFLVIEYHKGAGQGPLRVSALNRVLATLGKAHILGLIEEKAIFVTPRIPVSAIPPKNIAKDCIDCGHTHARAQSGDHFECSSCEKPKIRPNSEVKCSNLARLFVSPFPKKAEDEDEVGEAEESEEEAQASS